MVDLNTDSEHTNEAGGADGNVLLTEATGGTTIATNMLTWCSTPEYWRLQILSLQQWATHLFSCCSSPRFFRSFNGSTWRADEGHYTVGEACWTIA